MDNSDPRQRSYLPITRVDLERLLALAQEDRQQFFCKKSRMGAVPFEPDTGNCPLLSCRLNVLCCQPGAYVVCETHRPA